MSVQVPDNSVNADADHSLNYIYIYFFLKMYKAAVTDYRLLGCFPLCSRDRLLHTSDSIIYLGEPLGTGFSFNTFTQARDGFSAIYVALI